MILTGSLILTEKENENSAQRERKQYEQAGESKGISGPAQALQEAGHLPSDAVGVYIPRTPLWSLMDP